jgi:hypothetical protein
MARISTYAIDNNVTSQDKWIGTDSNGSVTKNFTPQGVADWINAANAVGVAGQITFRFQSDLTYGRSSGTISFDGAGGNGTAFSAITTIKASKFNSGDNLVINFLNTLVDEYILLCKTDNINNFGIYKLTAIDQDLDEGNFYDLSLTLVASNGNLESDEYYSVVAWPYNAGETNDKYYVHNQNNASVTWNVAHNLNKRPSVSVTLSTGQQGIAAVEYIDNNSLTITLQAAESGKAYLN